MLHEIKYIITELLFEFELNDKFKIPNIYDIAKVENSFDHMVFEIINRQEAFVPALGIIFKNN